MPLPYAWDPEYVESHLFAYIGNKRRLLPLIAEAIRTVEEEGSVPVDRRGLFVDYFSGTGVVARLARSLGFSVHANDWEDYSKALNEAFLGYQESDLNVFADEGGIDRVLGDLNRLGDYRPEDAYLSEFYCPADDTKPDIEKERLFYTRANGIRLDNIRAEIDRRYPEGEGAETAKKRKILLALLLVEASNRANTSGVFKGFHQGFGGLGADALGRILHPVTLTRPRLPENASPGSVTRLDALALAGQIEEEAEIAYLDPPYNQHQYGSNYHLLNTVVRNDRPPVEKSFWKDGKKTDKSAIRKDWTETKSRFCSKATALADFRALVARIRAKYILVSYSTDGLIPVEAMAEILATRGKVRLVTAAYVRFRGGRQCNTTVNKNLEFVLVADTHAASGSGDLAELRRALVLGRLAGMLSDPIPLDHLELRDGEIPLVVRLPIDRRLRVGAAFKSIYEPLPLDMLEALQENLKSVLPKTRDEEIHRILDLLERGADLDLAFLAKRVFTLFRKIHPQKSKEAWVGVARRLSAWLRPGTPFDPTGLDARSRKALANLAA
ncbi:MAG: DNA adenine methylase [Spirochaetes bacterium]|nr:DNA adenine methylase [Spirochaetota bacterium]